MATEVEWKAHDKEQLTELFVRHMRSWEAFGVKLFGSLHNADKEQVHRIIEGILIKKLCYLSIDRYLNDFEDYVKSEKINLSARHSRLKETLDRLRKEEKTPEANQLLTKLNQINSETSRVAPGDTLKVSSGKDFIEDNLDREDRNKSVYSPDFWRLECSPICRKVSLPQSPQDVGIPTWAALTDPVNGFPSFFIGSNGGGLKRFVINRTSNGKEAGQIEYFDSNTDNWASSLKTIEGLDGLGKGALLRDRYGFLRVVSVSPDGSLTCQNVGALAAKDGVNKTRYRSTCLLNNGQNVLIAAVRQLESKIDIIKLNSIPEIGKQVMQSECFTVQGEKFTGEQLELIWATNRTSSSNKSTFYAFAQNEGKLCKLVENHQSESTSYSMQAVATITGTKPGCLMAISKCSTVVVLSPTETGYQVHLLRHKEEDGGKHELLGKHELKAVGRIEFLALDYHQGSEHLQLHYVSRDCHACTVHLKVSNLDGGEQAPKFTGIERPDRSGKFSDLYEVVSAKAQTGITAKDKVVVLLTHKANYGKELAIMELSFN